MASLIVVYWRDIPAQVIAKKSRREQVKIVLDERFEKAI
ncbi:MAG: virulence factor, partial [Pseudomonadota bacterium]